MRCVYIHLFIESFICPSIIHPGYNYVDTDIQFQLFPLPQDRIILNNQEKLCEWQLFRKM
jgi:hypothetical protein